MKILLILFVIFGAETSFAQSSHTQSYIDDLKAGLPAEDRRDDSSNYSQKLKKSLPVEAPDTGYTEELRRTDPLRGKSESGYTESEKQRLGVSKSGSAIQSVKEGNSELKPVKTGKTDFGFGFKMAASSTRNITASKSVSGGRSYANVYGTDWAPDLLLSGEWRPLQNDRWGSLGLGLSAGVSYQTGTGTFQYKLTNPVTGASFGENSQTKLKFLTMPLLGEAIVRFNLISAVRPYLHGGASWVFYSEERSDGKNASKGSSKGTVMGGGINILLDFLAPKSSWDLYSGFNFQHFYFTLDMTKINATSGDVSFDVTSYYAGFAYEF